MVVDSKDALIRKELVPLVIGYLALNPIVDDKLDALPHRFDPSSLADALDEGDSFFDGPRPHVSLCGTVFTHLLELILHIARGSFPTAILDEFFSDDLP